MKYITADAEASFNIGFTFSPESLEELITRETITQKSVMILKVKRPDYLGDSMWEFRHEGHPFPAKIMHIAWLREFQERKFDVRPGDAIRALVQLDVHYGYDGEVVGTKRSILEVIEVVQNVAPLQQERLLP